MLQLIEVGRSIKSVVFNYFQLNALIAVALILPCAFTSMMAVSVVQSRLNGLAHFDAEIVRLKYDIEEERKSISPDQGRILNLETWLRDRQDERNGLAMQSAWGDIDARTKKSGDWIDFYHQLSSDNNIMIAAMAGATLGALLPIVLTSTGSPILACGAGIAIGVLAMAAAKGTKSFLISGPIAQTITLDPYTILLVSFLAGSYKSNIIELLHNFIRSSTGNYNKNKTE
jgi:hypothetical protein